MLGGLEGKRREIEVKTAARTSASWPIAGQLRGLCASVQDLVIPLSNAAASGRLRRRRSAVTKRIQAHRGLVRMHQRRSGGLPGEVSLRQACLDGTTAFRPSRTVRLRSQTVSNAGVHCSSGRSTSMKTSSAVWWTIKKTDQATLMQARATMPERDWPGAGEHYLRRPSRRATNIRTKPPTMRPYVSG